MHSDDPPVLVLAAPVEEFLREREGLVTYKIFTPQRRLLHGNDNLPSVMPLTQEPEFFNQEVNGISYRIVAQRVPSVAGDVIVEVADASNPLRRWLSQVFFKVVFPNLVLIVLFSPLISWAVRRAFRPLRLLIMAVEKRSPRDLSSIDVRSTPEEIRPLVKALNRLFWAGQHAGRNAAPLYRRCRAPAAYAAGRPAGARSMPGANRSGRHRPLASCSAGRAGRTATGRCAVR